MHTGTTETPESELDHLRAELEGMKVKALKQRAREEGDRIGLLLDLDAGSLTVYKNDARLGVMQESGLTDAAGYRWAVVLISKGDSARIDGDAVALPLAITL